MRFIFILITSLTFVLFSSCEPEPLPDFPELITIGCQSDADAAKALIGDAIFNPDNPEEGFRGDILITDVSGGCNPITDFSLFENFQFWRGAIMIESNQITDLSFLSNIQQIRAGLMIQGCQNLVDIDLPRMGAIAEFFIVENNPNLETISIGTSLVEDAFENFIIIDSLIISNNASLNTWEKAELPINFTRHVSIFNNPNLISLEAFSELSMPTQMFNMDLYGITVNPDNVNPDIDSLTMPRFTNINAMEPGNDYSWLNRAKDRDRFLIVEDTSLTGIPFLDTLKVDSITEFNISGNILIEELCDFQDIVTNIPLVISSNSAGLIDSTLIADNCP